MINRLATWAVKVTVPAADGQSAQVTALPTAVGTSLTGWFGKVVAILLAAFFCSSPWPTTSPSLDCFRIRTRPEASLGDGDEEAARAARLEIQALQELLVKMSPDQAAALRAEAEARIKKLGDELGIDVAIPVGGR